MAAAAGNMLDLEALVAASRDAAMGGSETATDQLHLPQVASHAQHLLAAIQQHRRELCGGGSVTTPPVPAREDDPQLAEQQGELLLCFRIFRNAAAAGPCAAAALLSCGLLELAGSTLDLLASAAIPLNWQLPAALAQALANFCTASREAAAAAWSALFPLHLSMLAHVTAGKGRGLGQGRQRPWWRGRASRWSRNGMGAVCLQPVQDGCGCPTVSLPLLPHASPCRLNAGRHLPSAAGLLPRVRRGFGRVGGGAGQPADDGASVQSTAHAAPGRPWQARVGDVSLMFSGHSRTMHSRWPSQLGRAPLREHQGRHAGHAREHCLQLARPAPPGSQGQHNDTLGLLVAHLCFQRDLMPSLFTSLGAGPRPGDGEGEAASGAALAAVAVQPTMAQSALLGLLCEEAQEVLQARG